MVEKPLLPLAGPVATRERGAKTGGADRTHKPSRAEQGKRLGPRFVALQRAFENRHAVLHADAAGLTPEEVVVLETAGAVEDFVVAVRNIQGLEWLGEVEQVDIPPDDDFFIVNTKAARTETTLRGRLFLVFANQQALRQIVSLWDAWRKGGKLPTGLSKWGEVFALLRDVRPWGVQERLLETGVLDDWAERSKWHQVVPCEIELWFRADLPRRVAGRARVEALVAELGGKIVQESIVEEIGYHALAVRIPVAGVRPLFEKTAQDVALVQCEQIQYFRAAGQMGVLPGELASDKANDVSAAPVPALGNPVVALLDGLPMENHHRLAGRLVVDDPDNYASGYQAAERVHGTTMASLILHGDIDAAAPPLERKLYVRPILRPDPNDWRNPRPEFVSESELAVDLLHRAVRRLFESTPEQPAVAPEVCVINLSIGIADRWFVGALSPLARVLDWLAWKYKVLFVVSAGNHMHDIELSVPHASLATMSAGDLQLETIRAIAADARNRRLYSPAEAINALTVGAIHSDSSSGPWPPGVRSPYTGQDLPSVINAQGMGYRRGIKPEVLLPGGRMTFRPSRVPATAAKLELLLNTQRPGQRVAAPGATPGDAGKTFHTAGTSNSTALASRLASELYDVLDELRGEPGGAIIDSVPRALWLKALLAHGARWGIAGTVLTAALKTRANSRQFKEYLTRLIGYGAIDAERLRQCTKHRVTGLSAGTIQREQCHVHRFPLPPSLSGHVGWRRIVITLAWFSPVNMLHQSWRRADLWFSAPSSPLTIDRQEADWHAVQRGTVQHEILEGDRAAAFVDGDCLEVRVNCREDAGALEEAVPYALAITLEVAQSMRIDIYNEIRARVQAQVRVSTR